MERTREGWLGSTKGEHKRMVYYGSMIDTLQTLGFITGIANFQHQDIINESTKKERFTNRKKNLENDNNHKKKSRVY